MNEEDLRFCFDKENRILKASTKKPLLLENNFIGYTVEYDLITFEYDYPSSYILILGTSNFNPKEGTNSSLKQWGNNRQNAYNGSIEHFVKS